MAQVAQCQVGDASQVSRIDLADPRGTAHRRSVSDSVAGSLQCRACG